VGADESAGAAPENRWDPLGLPCLQAVSGAKEIIPFTTHVGGLPTIQPDVVALAPGTSPGVRSARFAHLHSADGPILPLPPPKKPNGAAPHRHGSVRPRTVRHTLGGSPRVQGGNRRGRPVIATAALES